MTEWDETILATCGSGKTATTLELLARVNDKDTVDWIDPNGDSDERDDRGTGVTDNDR